MSTPRELGLGEGKNIIHVLGASSCGCIILAGTCTVEDERKMPDELSSSFDGSRADDVDEHADSREAQSRAACLTKVVICGVKDLAECELDSTCRTRMSSRDCSPGTRVCELGIGIINLEIVGTRRRRRTRWW